MYNNKYVGNRYVPLMGGEHDKTKEYEPLVVVTKEGNSYTSNRYVPIGVDITNLTYWTCTGNYNAQVENYRHDVIILNDNIETFKNDVDSSIETIKSHINNSEYNVKNYGAKGDGVTDDWNAINTVLNLVKDTGGTIMFPTGVYCISKPLEINNVPNATLLHNIVLKGVESNIPYFDSYGENSNKLAMNSNIIPTSDFVGDSLIIIGRVANSLILNLGIIGALNKTAPRNIKGIKYNSSPIVSNHGVKSCAIFRCSTGIDGYNAPILKVEYTNVQYCKDTGIIIRGDSRVVECEVSATGLSLNGVSGESSTAEIFNPTGFYGGTGILVIDSAGNTNIIGGLIDWNCKGIVCDAGSGLIVNGVRFHHNAEQHIYFRQRGGSLGACGFNVTGCRFLGGGFKVGSLDGKCAITITNEATTTAHPILGNISSNVFRVGDWTAGEISDGLISTPNVTTGPINSAIVVKVSCDTDLTISSNDMVNGDLNLGSIGVAQSDTNKLAKIKFIGNNTKKWGWSSGNTRIYFNTFYPTVNGKPTFTGVNGDKTENASIDIYAWNNYIYSTSENAWRGVNQRNIKYDTTANRPTMDSYTDRGYEYYDTTLGKRLIWDGVVWRDNSGISV